MTYGCLIKRQDKKYDLKIINHYKKRTMSSRNKKKDIKTNNNKCKHSKLKISHTDAIKKISDVPE